MSEDKRYMFFTLYNGARYEEMDRQQGYERTYPHTTLSFSEERIVFDMYAFSLNRTDENLFKDNYQMLNVVQLKRATDSLNNSVLNKGNNLRSNLDQFFHLNDSLYGRIKAQALSPDSLGIKKNMQGADGQYIVTHALNAARSAKGYVEFSMNEINDTQKLVVRHEIEWHRKFTLSIACIVMFFIGAPFGTIIRKGGFGMPVVISVLLYIFFHILSITGEKMAKTMTSTPVSGMWLAIMILVPIGFFLTYQAANDSGLFDKSAWVKLVKRLAFRQK
jgi:lipopolysaccharide export system permease protein